MSEVSVPFFHIVLARFRQDADPAELKDFLDSAPGSMAAAPFRVVAMGPDLDLGLTPACDWGYVAEVSDLEQLATWEHQSDHDALREKMLKIRETVMSIQLPVAPTGS